jgi:hypothetical protein
VNPLRYPDRFIELRAVPTGPWKGRWAWRVNVPPKPVSKNAYREGARNGIAADKERARRTALRMLRWHLTP